MVVNLKDGKVLENEVTGDQLKQLFGNIETAIKEDYTMNLPGKETQKASAMSSIEIKF